MTERVVVFLGGRLTAPDSPPSESSGRVRQLARQARKDGADAVFFRHGFSGGLYGYFDTRGFIPLGEMPERVEAAFDGVPTRRAVCISASGVTAINLAIRARCDMIHGLGALTHVDEAIWQEDPRLADPASSLAINQGLELGWGADNAAIAREIGFKGKLILAYAAKNPLDSRHAMHMADLPGATLHGIARRGHVFWKSWADYSLYT
ncbi:hypothetical protein [Pseudotabrizicola algicola]|uniref:Alpha/beta hydrolase n=1 Tax=Pseudotabrizicola algicola TaxID=2709381 RepID=A0A6B3RXA5_9RHOB|nr:hypothetical protein [Pseudotabrizicola algicola]NEX47742.1 hypothetical protein [Pseudotabrizicola algicola]